MRGDVARSMSRASMVTHSGNRARSRETPVAVARSAARWNPFANVPSRVEGAKLTADERARADASDGVFGENDSARAIRSPKALSRALSKPDSYFHGMGVEFAFDATLRERSLDDLNKLFVDVGFSRRSEEKLLKAIENSHACLYVRATRDSRFAKEGQTVAFARVTSDGTFNAIIWDVCVLPAWQRSGLGRGMVERIVERLLGEDICNVSLYAEKKVVGMYETLGFATDPLGARAMTWRLDSQAY